MLPKICLVHPGHALSTAFVYDGYFKYLDHLGCDIMECRTDKLIAFASHVVESTPGKFNGDQNASSDTWKMHLAQQLMLIRILECQVEKPDLTLVICGKLISPQNYGLFNLIPGNKVVLLTESPYEDSAQAWYSQFYDFAFVNDLVSVPVIGHVVPTAYMPHGYDPSVFCRYMINERGHQMAHADQVTKRFVTSFIGTPFGNRKPIIEAISQRFGDEAYIFDSATYTDPADGQQYVKFVPPWSAAQCYHETKVNLNIHRTETFFGNGEHIAAAHSLGPRAFEIAGCGEFQLCDNSRPELVGIFGDTIATYDSPAEVPDRIAYWADPARDSLRRDMALASYEIAQQHTYHYRAARLVEQCAEWYNRPDWLEQENDG